MTGRDDQKSRYWLTEKSAEVVSISQGCRSIRAAALNERHMGRLIRIGNTEGPLIALMTSQVRVDVVLIVGGARAIFPLAPDTEVEVGPKHTKENP